MTSQTDVIRANLRLAVAELTDHELRFRAEVRSVRNFNLSNGARVAFTRSFSGSGHNEMSISIDNQYDIVLRWPLTLQLSGARDRFLYLADHWNSGIWNGQFILAADIGLPVSSWNRAQSALPTLHEEPASTVDSQTAMASATRSSTVAGTPRHVSSSRPGSYGPSELASGIQQRMSLDDRPSRDSRETEPSRRVTDSLIPPTESVHSHRRNSNSSSGSHNPFELGRNEDPSHPTDSIPGRSRSDSSGRLHSSANVHRRMDSGSSDRSLALSQVANPFSLVELSSESSGDTHASSFSQSYGRSPSQSHVTTYTAASGTLGSLPSGSTDSQLMDGSGPTGSSTSWPVERPAWADRYGRADNHSDYRSSASGHRSNSSRDSNPSGHRSNSSGHLSNSSGQYSSPLAGSPARTGFDNPTSAPTQPSAYPVAAPYQGVSSYTVQTSEDYNPSNPAYALPTRGNTSYHPGATRSDRSNSFGQRSDTSGHHLGSPAYPYQGPANFGNSGYPQTQPFMDYRPRPREEYADEDSD